MAEDRGRSLVRDIVTKRSRSRSGSPVTLTIDWNNNRDLYIFFLHVDMLHDFLDTRRSTPDAIRLVKNIVIDGHRTMQQYVGTNLYGDNNYTGEFSNIEDAFAETLIAARPDLLGLQNSNIPIAACEYKPGKQVDECINSRYIKIPKKANTNQLFQKILQIFRSRQSVGSPSVSPLTYTCDASPWIANRVIDGYQHVKTVSTLLDSAVGVSNTADFVAGSILPYQMKNILTRNSFTITRTLSSGIEPPTIRVNISFPPGTPVETYDSVARQGPTLGELANIVDNPPNRIRNGLGWLENSYNMLTTPELKQKFIFDIKTSQDADQTIEAKERDIQCFFTVDKLCSMGAIIQQIPVVVFCSSDHAMMYINTSILGTSSIDNEIYKIKNILSQNQSLNDKIGKYGDFISRVDARVTTPLFTFLVGELKKIFEAILNFIQELNIANSYENVTNFVNGILNLNESDKNELVQRAYNASRPIVNLQTVISTIDLLIDDPDTYLNDLKRYEMSIERLVGDRRINERTLRRNRELVANDDSFLVKVNKLTNILSFNELFTYVTVRGLPASKRYSLSLKEGSITINATEVMGGGNPDEEMSERDTPAAAAESRIADGSLFSSEVDMDELDELDELKTVYKKYITGLIKIITDSSLSYTTVLVGEKVTTAELMNDNEPIDVFTDDDEIVKDLAAERAVEGVDKWAHRRALYKRRGIPTPSEKRRLFSENISKKRTARASTRRYFNTSTGKRRRDDDVVVSTDEITGAPVKHAREAAAAWAGGNRYTRKRRIHVKIRRNGVKTSKRRTKTLKHTRRR